MKRVISLDVLKYVACFIVINIHMNLPTQIEAIIQPFLTVAVPIFFMITGFFYTQICDAGAAKKQIKKIARLVIVGNLVHLGYLVFKHIINGESLLALAAKLFEPSAIINFLIFNQPVWRTSLWYINALLYVLIIIYLIQRKQTALNKFYPAIPLLLICNLLVGTYSVVLPVEPLLLCYSRNFLFCGVPYFLIGDYIYHNKTWLCKRYGSGVYVFLFSILAYVELFVLNFVGALHHKDHLISTPFLVVSLFCLFVKQENEFQGRVWKTIAELGRKHSFVIYIAHSIIIEIFYKVFSKISVSLPAVKYLFESSGPLAVLVISTFLAIVINGVSKKVKVCLGR